MMKYVFLLLLWGPLVLAQSSSERPKSNLIIHNSLTYAPLEQYQHPIWNYMVINHELSWTLNLGVEFHPLYRTSLQNTLFMYFVEEQPARFANITGITHQFNPLYRTSYRAYGEIGTHIGRYCSCNPQLRRMDDPRFSISLGMGGNVWLTPKLDLTISMIHHVVFNPPPDHAGLTRYFIGIEYYFRKRSYVGL